MMVIKEDNLSDEFISFEDIQNARYSSSFMDDRAWLTIDGLAYAKIGKNKWKSQPTLVSSLEGRALKEN